MPLPSLLLIMSKVSMSWKHDQSQVFAEVAVLSLSEVSVQFMQITSKVLHWQSWVTQISISL